MATYKLPPIPTPPATVSAPVAVDVAVVFPVTDNVPALTIPEAEILVTPVMLLLPDPVITTALNVPVPPTFKLPPIPTPPATVNAPVVELELTVVLVIVNMSGEVTSV